MKTNQEIKKEFFNRLANKEPIQQIQSSLDISECEKDIWLRQGKKPANNRLLLDHKHKVAHIGERIFHEIMPQATWLSATNKHSKFDFIYGDWKIEVKAATPVTISKNGSKLYAVNNTQQKDNKCIVVIFLLPNKCRGIGTDKDVINMMKNVQALMIPSFMIAEKKISYSTSGVSKYEPYRLKNINELNKRIQRLTHEE